jgi:2-C-methyl-D-erythritol 2,4-cyclodiphosphate synthase
MTAQGLRCGIGYDSHRMVDGRKLLLGGVEVPSPRGLLGHSDGDVLCHAITDALLGAAGLGDIGQHFSNSDPRWKQASSLVFLRQVKALLEESRWQIVNIDSVVILDEPKLAPFMQQFKSSIAGALGIEPEAVSVKAKTSEGVSPDMAAAQAVALLRSTAIA